MYNDEITVLRNEFDEIIEKGGENCLCDETIVRMATELENKIRSFVNLCN